MAAYGGYGGYGGYVGDGAPLMRTTSYEIDSTMQRLEHGQAGRDAYSGRAVPIIMQHLRNHLQSVPFFPHKGFYFKEANPRGSFAKGTTLDQSDLDLVLTMNIDNVEQYMQNKAAILQNLHECLGLGDGPRIFLNLDKPRTHSLWFQMKIDGAPDVDPEKIRPLLKDGPSARSYSLILSGEQVALIKVLPVHAKRIIRLLKRWSNRKFAAAKRTPPSYLFEVIVYELCEANKLKADDSQFNLILALQSIKSRSDADGIGMFVRDPVNPHQPLWDTWWDTLVSYAEDVLAGKEDILKALV